MNFCLVSLCRTQVHQRLESCSFTESHWSQTCASRGLPSSKESYSIQREKLEEPCQGPPLTQVLLYQYCTSTAWVMGTVTGNPNLLLIPGRPIPMLHVNEPLGCFDCFIWLALSEVRSGQTVMVIKDESHTSGKCHFAKNKVRMSLISWSAGLIQIWVAVLLSSASIFFKKRLSSATTVGALLTIEFVISCGFRIAFRFPFPLWPWRVTSPSHTGKWPRYCHIHTATLLRSETARKHLYKRPP